MDELMFAPTLDIPDARTAKRVKNPPRHATLQRAMKELHLYDRAASDRFAQCAGGTLDFRQLGHECALLRSVDASDRVAST
jgi:hypothetical protein